MDFTVDAQIGGKLAMLGSRLIDSTAQSLAGQFFTKFGSLMKAQGAAVKPTKPKAAVKKLAAKKATVKKPAAKKTPPKKVAKKR